jgi:hypothetical protein
MSRRTTALWGGLAGAMFGTFQSSFPVNWGGPVGLLMLIVLVIAPIAWTFEHLRRRRSAKQGQVR